MRPSVRTLTGRRYNRSPGAVSAATLARSSTRGWSIVGSSGLGINPTIAGKSSPGEQRKREVTAYTIVVCEPKGRSFRSSPPTKPGHGIRASSPDPLVLSSSRYAATQSRAMRNGSKSPSVFRHLSDIENRRTSHRVR